MSVRQLMVQPDCGDDYEDGDTNGAAKCAAEGCFGSWYVTHMCYGNPELDSGKFHNHCTQCRGNGRCIGDIRESHCPDCGKHYFAGTMGTFPCHHCERRGYGGGRRYGGGDYGMEGDCSIM